MRYGESAMVGIRVLSFRLLMMLKRLSNVIFSKSEYFVESKKDDGVTAVNSEFNFPKARIWFRALRDGDVIVENANVCSQRNSVWGHCSARLGAIRLAIRKIGRGSDCENIDARWRKRDGREFRLRFSRLLIRVETGSGGTLHGDSNTVYAPEAHRGDDHGGYQEQARVRHG